MEYREFEKLCLIEVMMSNKMKILAISGSLRTHASNTNILKRLGMMAPENVEVVLYEGLGSLPHFNPVLDDENSSGAVKDFRQKVCSADGVIICTPEYAFGFPAR